MRKIRVRGPIFNSRADIHDLRLCEPGYEVEVSRQQDRASGSKSEPN